ncbi:nuclear transport factor 2 family protein [Flavobacterium psychrotrophum]|uniref:nuclear transport factor 2 family protein n=1 Tax=Flavobacterium psychrotrophum TaxID=2294119 RepID=UPI000E30B59A|nr:nuclear transport factor 2 family protein [Flavobacterium psychrotrophum]
MKQHHKQYFKTGVISMLIAALFSIGFMNAQERKGSDLYLKAIKMDSLLFDQGFNNCNYKILDNILADDLEFYHDKGGIQNKKEFIDATRNNICNSPDGKITRRIVAGSIEVCAMEKNGVVYGALETGEHEFYMQEPGKSAYKTGRAKFTCLWVIDTKGSWKLKRVFSYNHQPAE